MSKKCLIIGSTVCDILLHVDALPQTQGVVHLSDQKFSLGGCAYNVVSILHRLNVPYTFISPVGTGVYGEFVSEQLAQQGIKTSIRVAEENGCCYCVVEASGERTFMSYHKAEYTFDASWLDPFDLSEYAYVYVCGLEVEEVNGQELVDALKDFPGQVVFAPGPRIEHLPEHLLMQLYSYSPILHLNEYESRLLSGHEDVALAVRQLYTLTNQTVVVTLGDRGTVYFDGETLEYVDAYSASVVDTIGAGDSHVGGILAGLSQQQSFVEAIDFANFVASQVVATTGVHLSADSIERMTNRLYHAKND